MFLELDVYVQKAVINGEGSPIWTRIPTKRSLDWIFLPQVWLPELRLSPRPQAIAVQEFGQPTLW